MSKLTGFIFIVISIGLYYTFTVSQRERVRQLSVEADEYGSVLDDISRIVETRDALLAVYETIPKAEIEKLSRVLPEDLDTVRFALDLDHLAAQSGIAVKDIQVETGAPKDSALIVLPRAELPYQRTSVSFSFVSDYQSFRRFLSGLERNLRIMDVKSLSFNSGTSDLYEHRITVDTYSLRPRDDMPVSTAGVGGDLLGLSLELSKAALNQDLFKNRSYLSLKDSSAVIPVEPLGRLNPFSTIGRD